MAKFCQNCGTPYEEGTMFCSGCGSNLAGKPAAKKSAITLAGVQELAEKKIKLFTIIIMLISLFIGLACISGSYKVDVNMLYKNDVVRFQELEVKELYVKNSDDKMNGACVSVKVLNIIYGIMLLGVAGLAAWSLLEKACGGCGMAQFKLAAISALGATFLFALLFFILGRRDLGNDQDFIIEVPVSAWVNLVYFGFVSAVAYLKPKKA